MAKIRECCSALSLRRTGDDLHVSLHQGFKIRLAGIVPVSLEFTGLARCLSPLNSKLRPVRRSYSWVGDHLNIASCWFSKKIGTHVNRFVVVGLSHASRVFLQVLRFSSLRKMNLTFIHLSFTGPPLITVFLHWRGLPCINIILLLVMLFCTRVVLFTWITLLIQSFLSNFLNLFHHSMHQCKSSRSTGIASDVWLCKLHLHKHDCSSILCAPAEKRRLFLWKIIFF